MYEEECKEKCKQKCIDTCGSTSDRQTVTDTASLAVSSTLVTDWLHWFLRALRCDQAEECRLVPITESYIRQ